jgi:hypothetical protein
MAARSALLNVVVRWGPSSCAGFIVEMEAGWLTV